MLKNLWAKVRIGIVSSKPKDHFQATPWYERNSFWGAVTIFVALILAGVAFMMHDPRILFWIAAPFGIFIVQCILKGLHLRQWLIVPCIVLIGLSLLWINTWLTPNTQNSGFSTTAGKTIHESGRTPESSTKQTEQPKQPPPKKEGPQAEQSKPPVPPNVAPEVQVKLIFKDSPLFTPKRKQKITVDIDAFRKYLIGLGFDVPKEIPPIGTSAGKGWTMAFSSNGPIFYDSIMIGDKEIDNPESWRRATANHFFMKIFPWHSTDDIDIELARTWTIWIFAEYFASSYANKRPKQSHGMNGWVDVLWDIRDSCGKDFTDGSLFYASKIDIDKERKDNRGTSTPNKPPSTGTNTKEFAQDFNKYFSERFISGSFVLDNNLRNRQKILKILRQYNFIKMMD